MKNRVTLFAASSLGLLFTSVGSLSAQTTTWVGTSANPNWDVPSNWSNGVPNASSTAVISGTVTVPSNLTPSTPAVASAVTSSGTLTIASGGDLQIGSQLVLTGSSTLTVQSNGTLGGLNGSAPVVVLNGTSNAYLLGDTSQVNQLVGYGNTTTGNPTIYFGIDATGTQTSAAQTVGDIDTLGNVVLGKASGTASTTLTINATNNQTYFTDLNNSGTLLYSPIGSEILGVVSGSGNLVVQAANAGNGGTLYLFNANTYTGTTTVANSGTLALVGLGTIANSKSVTVTTNGTFDISNATTASGGSGVTVLIHDLNSGPTPDSTGKVALGSNTLNVVETDNTTFAGAIGGTGSLIVSGPSTLKLTGDNGYTGKTTIVAGSTLALAGGANIDSIANSSNVVVNGTLDVSGATAAQTINNLSGGGSVNLGAKTMDAVQSGTSIFAGTISGTGGAVNASGNGTLVLTGANTYTGGTTLSGAVTVQVGNDGTTGSIGTGAVTIGSGTTLAVNFAPISNNVSYTLNNALSGAGTLNQLNGYTVINNGADTAFTGATNVTGGILEIDSAFGNGSGTVSVSNGGALIGSGNVAATVNVTNGYLSAGTATTTGHLTVGALNLTSDSVVVLKEMSGLSDSIIVTGAVHLAGTLEFLTSGTTTLTTNGLNGITDPSTTPTTFTNVIVTGTGTLDLAGYNSFAGNLLIDQQATVAMSAPLGDALAAAASVKVNGTLDATTNGGTIQNLSGSGTVATGNQTLVVKNNTNTLFAGTITGTNTNGSVNNLQVSGDGRLVLTGTNTYNGTFVGSGDGTQTTVLQVGNGGAGGTLGSGNLFIDQGTTVAYYHSSGTTSIVSNNISGGGTFQVDGGNVILASVGGNTGNDTLFAGTVNVDGGSLEVDNTLIDQTLGATVVNVNSTGVVRGNGNIAAPNVNINAGGTLAAGTASSVGTLTITGNLNMAPGALAAFRVTGPGVQNQDLVVVNGTATVHGNATFYVTGVPVRDGDSFQVIQGTSVTGNFDSVPYALNNALYFHSVNEGGTAIDFIATQGSFVPFSKTGNQASVAANLDAMAHDSRSSGVIDYLNTLPGAQLGAAFNQILPTPVLALPNLLQASSDNVSQALSQRMGSLRSGANGLAIQNVDLGPNIAFDPRSLLADNSDSAPIGYTPLAPDFLTPSSQNRWGTFISGLGTAGSVDDSELPGYNYYSGGMQLGIDYRILPSWVLGIAGGYQHGKADFNDSSSRIDTDTGNIHLYSTWNDKSGDWIAGNVGGSYNWFNSKRDSLDGTASAKPHGTEIDGIIEGGHDFQLRNSWTITPTIGVLYDHVSFDSFTETGSLTPLSIDSHEADSFRSRLGITLASAVHAGSSVLLNPYVQVGWQHEYLDQNQSVSASFANGAGGVFTTSGQSIGGDSATFGLGVSSLLSPSVSVSVGYFGQANSDYLENNLQGTVRYQF